MVHRPKAWKPTKTSNSEKNCCEGLVTSCKEDLALWGEMGNLLTNLNN
jgi:hypothetical protein